MTAGQTPAQGEAALLQALRMQVPRRTGKHSGFNQASIFQQLQLHWAVTQGRKQSSTAKGKRWRNSGRQRTIKPWNLSRSSGSSPHLLQNFKDLAWPSLCGVSPLPGSVQSGGTAAVQRISLVLLSDQLQACCSGTGGFAPGALAVAVAQLDSAGACDK